MKSHPLLLFPLLPVLCAVVFLLAGCDQPTIDLMSRNQDVAGLIEALSFEDPAIRIAAAQALGELGDTRAVQPLMSGLKAGDDTVRRTAAATLAQLSTDIRGVVKRGDQTFADVTVELGNLDVSGLCR